MWKTRQEFVGSRLMSAWKILVVLEGIVVLSDEVAEQHQDA